MGSLRAFRSDRHEEMAVELVARVKSLTDVALVYGSSKGAAISWTLII